MTDKKPVLAMNNNKYYKTTGHAELTEETMREAKKAQDIIIKL